MTPAETFAQSRAQAESLIRQLAPARLQDATIERLLPAIALTARRADDDEIAIGASKFGGAPDVPTGFAWPRWNETPLCFMAQINLAEIAPFDIENKLPASGLLLFFYALNEEDETPWGEPDQFDGWQVFHFQDALERAIVPDQAKVEFGLATATVSAEIFCSVPTSTFWIDYDDEEQTLNNEEYEQWEELQDQIELPPLTMLGHPQIIQHDARMEAAQYAKRGATTDWHLLLQMDGDDEIDWMWGDAGAMFYLMHRDDLQVRAWDKCWLIAQCS